MQPEEFDKFLVEWSSESVKVATAAFNEHGNQTKREHVVVPMLEVFTNLLKKYNIGA